MKPADEHGTIDQLLPLYANGSLDAGMRHRIATHLETCAECREELKFLGDVRQVLRQSVAADRVPAPPVEARFETLPPELQLRVRDAKRPVRADTRSFAASAAMAAALFAAIALGVSLTVTKLQEPLYRTATTSSAIADGHLRVAVRFGADVEFRQINQLLRQHRAIIVRGPDEQDRWLLEIPLSERTQAEELMPMLRSAPGIEAVEQIGIPETGE